MAITLTNDRGVVFQNTIPNKLRYDLLTYIFILINTAYAVFVRYETQVESGKTALDLLTHGNGYLPFQARFLVPFIMRWFIDWGASARNVVMLSEFIFMSLAAFGLMTYITEIGFPYIYRIIGVILLFYIIPHHYFLIYYFPYDLPALAVTVWGLVFIQQERWNYFGVLLIIGTLNRETTLFLLLIMAFDKKLLFSKKFILFGIIYVILKLGIAYYFRNNPTTGYGIFDLQVFENIRQLSNPITWTLFLSVFGGLWIPIMLFWDKITNKQIKQRLYASLFMMGILFMVGVIHEVRIYGEMIPIIIAANLILIYRLFLGKYDGNK